MNQTNDPKTIVVPIGTVEKLRLLASTNRTIQAAWANPDAEHVELLPAHLRPDEVVALADYIDWLEEQAGQISGTCFRGRST